MYGGPGKASEALAVDPKSYRASYNYAVAMETQNPESYDANISNWSEFIRTARNKPKAKNDLAVAEQHVKELRDAKATAKTP